MTEITLLSDISVEMMQHVGSDAFIAHTARVSTRGIWRDSSSGPVGVDDFGLIGFLMKNRHGSPFEHGLMTFRVHAPIFVFREWHRHRIGWSYNEESGRYKQLDPVFYAPAVDRNLTQVGKPGHYRYEPGSDLQKGSVRSTIAASADRASHYQVMLDQGIAREVARTVLPVGIYSSMYATCNPRSLMAFLSLRTNHPEATFPSSPQREIEIAAEQMESVFEELFPATYEAFVKNGRVAP